MKNKKAQIGTTITWITAFLIIAFIIFVFLGATMILRIRKEVTKIDITSIDSLQPIDLQRKTINILSQKVQSDGEQRTSEFIISSVEPYIDPIEQDKWQTYGVHEIDDLASQIDTMPNSALTALGTSKAKEQEKLDSIRQQLDEDCKNYVLQMPLGFIYNVDGEGGAELDYLDSTHPLYKKSGFEELANNMGSLTLYYQGQEINVQYAEEFIC